MRPSLRYAPPYLPPPLLGPHPTSCHNFSPEGDQIDALLPHAAASRKCNFMCMLLLLCVCVCLYAGRSAGVSHWLWPVSQSWSSCQRGGQKADIVRYTLNLPVDRNDGHRVSPKIALHSPRATPRHTCHSSPTNPLTQPDRCAKFAADRWQLLLSLLLPLLLLLLLLLLSMLQHAGHVQSVTLFSS